MPRFFFWEVEFFCEKLQEGERKKSDGGAPRQIAKEPRGESVNCRRKGLPAVHCRRMLFTVHPSNSLARNFCTATARFFIGFFCSGGENVCQRQKK